MTGKTINPVILVHGGAWDIPISAHQDHVNGIENALRAGQKILKETDDPVETVIEIIKILENDPAFDAGTGSFLNDAGEVEMDAGIMYGADLTVGAVAAIQQVKHPIEVAELVRAKTQHVMLAGEGATIFAKKNAIEMVSTESLLTGREKERYLSLKLQGKVRIKSFFEDKPTPSDTVGAVVINSRGEMAAGTSTGGTPFKMQGRIGDSPIAGAGYYADDTIGAASTTGWGESIMRVMLAKTALEYLKAGNNADIAADLAIKDLETRVSGNGGIILLDKNGNWAFAHNTPFMAVGAATTEKLLFISMGNRPSNEKEPSYSVSGK
ncbi:MAG: isoaspartyl peptidase/L-asparaginase [Calditrichaceae bacterium]